MKMRILAGVLVLSVAMNVWLLSMHSREKRPTSSTNWTANNPFTFTNTGGVTNPDSFIVMYKDGKYWWSIDGRMLSLNVGFHQEADLQLNETNDRIKTTTIGLLDDSGKEHHFIDYNADGIPDSERIYSGDPIFRVFYGGKFIPSFVEGTNRCIVQDGKNVAIKFNGKQWAPK